MFIHFVGRGNKAVAQEDTYPGLGAYPTRLWKSGEVIAEEHHLQVFPDAEAPALARLVVGMYTLSNMKRLDASNEKKKPLGNAPILAEIKLTSLKPAPKPTNPLSNANFEDTVELVGFDLDQSKVHSGDDLQLTLYWRARQNITEDYTVFAQLLSSGDIIYGQKDGQPAGGEYPTRLWDEGEIVADRRVIRVQSDAPVGKYRLIAGMYLPATNRRLTIVGSQNQDFLTISEITVSSGNVHD